MTSWHHFLIFHEQPPPSSELDMAIDSDFNIMGLQQQTQIVTIKKKKPPLSLLEKNPNSPDWKDVWSLPLRSSAKPQYLSIKKMQQ